MTAPLPNQPVSNPLGKPKRHLVSTLGFSIVELMVGMTVGLIGLAAVGLIYSSSAKSSRVVYTSIDASDDVRYLFERMREDIQRAGTTSCGISPPAGLYQVNLTNAQGTPIGVGTVGVTVEGDPYCFTTSATSNDCAFSYQAAYENNVLVCGSMMQAKLGFTGYEPVNNNHWCTTARDTLRSGLAVRLPSGRLVQNRVGAPSTINDEFMKTWWEYGILEVNPPPVTSLPWPRYARLPHNRWPLIERLTGISGPLPASSPLHQAVQNEWLAGLDAQNSRSRTQLATPPEGLIRTQTTGTVGGTVSGLPGGASVKLLLNNDSTSPLTVSSNTTFRFAKVLKPGTPYQVSFMTAGITGNAQCSILADQGEMSATGFVSNVLVKCASFTLGSTTKSTPTISNTNGLLVQYGSFALTNSGRGAGSYAPLASNLAAGSTTNLAPTHNITSGDTNGVVMMLSDCSGAQVFKATSGFGHPAFPLPFDAGSAILSQLKSVFYGVGFCASNSRSICRKEFGPDANRNQTILNQELLSNQVKTLQFKYIYRDFNNTYPSYTSTWNPDFVSVIPIAVVVDLELEQSGADLGLGSASGTVVRRFSTVIPIDSTRTN